MGYRCRKCGFEFNETTSCEAAPQSLVHTGANVRSTSIAQTIAAMPLDKRIENRCAALAFKAGLLEKELFHAILTGKERLSDALSSKYKGEVEEAIAKEQQEGAA